MPAPRPDARLRLVPLAAAFVAAAALALGLPALAGLGGVAGALASIALGVAFAVGMIGGVAGLAWSVREEAWSSECEAQLLELACTLPIGVVVLGDGRVRAANDAACLQLGTDAASLQAVDPATLFDDPDDARAALADQAFDRDVQLRRADGGRTDAHVAARDVRLGARAVRLLLLGDLGEARRMASRLEVQRGELQTLARRLMTVQEDERASLSRELHDDIGQAITAIKLCASSLAHEPDPMRRAVVVETAGEIAQIADQTVAKLRDLSLLLRPPQLDVLGLEAALRWQAGTLFRGDGPVLTLEVPPLPCRPPRDVELACFRIAQEALTNVLRHAQARRVVLRLSCDEAWLRLQVDDDGNGLAPDRRDGLGLVTMRERAQQLGGTFAIESEPGATRIDVALPLAAPA